MVRFSALTGRAHRIHRDETRAAVAVKVFAPPIVCGPIFPLHTELARGHFPTGDDLRVENPVYVGNPIEVRGSPCYDAIELPAHSGGVHASGRSTGT